MKALKISLMWMALALVTMLGASDSVSADNHDWTATYWNNIHMDGAPVLERGEDFIFYQWGYGSPAEGVVNRDAFSARWTRTLEVSAGTYRFDVNADDGMRVYVDGLLLIDAWYDTNNSTVSNYIYLTAQPHEVVVEYYEAGGEATAQLSFDKVLDGDDSNTDAPAAANPAWTGHYYNNVGLRGNPSVVREDAEINFDWGTGSPADGIGIDAFSVRWTNTLDMQPGRYRFTMTVDDGVRLYVNGKLLINEWRTEQARTVSAETTLYGGDVPITVEYFESKGEARINMYWTMLYPIGQEAETPTQPEPVTATAQMLERTPLRRTYGFGAPAIGYAEFEEVVDLAGQRNADTTWIRIINRQGIWGWVPVETLNTDYPLETLDVWESDW